MRLGDCEYRDELLYDPDAGTWAIPQGGLWKVGVTPLICWLSGGFTSVSLKKVGLQIAEGRVLGSVEGPTHFEVVRAPFECIIREINPRPPSDPRIVNRDPFGRGWLALLEKTGGRSRLLPLGKAAPAIEEKLHSLRVHCFTEFPDMEMYEIGVECSAVLVKLNELFARSPLGTIAHIVSDDPTAEIEMSRWGDQTGNALVEVRTEGALHHFLVKKS